MSFDLQVTPSTLEVDFDKNLTDLYRAITDQNWSHAVSICRKDPVQAATWVVRHYDDEDEDDEQEIMWRFLPIHSACARQPPANVISALVKAYPDGPKCIDDQGMYALHYACGNQASRDVIRLLLVSCPEASQIPDPRGMLPIHYLACWGPSAVAVVDMMLVSHREVANIRDDEGNTPLDLARDGEYPERDEVIDVLKRWMGDYMSDGESKKSSGMSKRTAQSTIASQAQSTAISHAQSSVTMSHAPTMTNAASIMTREDEEEEKKEDDHSVVSKLSRTSKVSRKSQLTKGTATTRATRESENSKLNALVLMKEREVEDLKAQLKKESIREENKVHWEGVAKTWQARFESLEEQFQSQSMELASTKSELEAKTNSFSVLEEELQEAQRKLEETRNECDGLRETLGDLLDQHESFKKRSGSMNTRLGSLTTSLDSMMEHQSVLQNAMKKRNQTAKETFLARKAKLQQLIEIEESLKNDEEKLEQSLEKQSRELEAIAAVIKAARD